MTCPVHPRVRGEHGGGCVDCGIHSRSIPACAGNTPRWSGVHRGTSVHPRVRGEHAVRDRPAAGSRSVHPRVRGEHGVQLDMLGAGFGPSPRARGTRANSSINRHASRGPSPRARGTRGWLGRGRTRRWSIPACAGNTISSQREQTMRSVHPRVRGEHTPRKADMGVPSGPSPRARGTQGVLQPGVEGDRSIPACAGNTWASFSTPAAPSGPSPRARGTRCGPHSTHRSTAVHPRVRGEHGCGKPGSMSHNGPSPRARGTP